MYSELEKIVKTRACECNASIIAGLMARLRCGRITFDVVDAELDRLEEFEWRFITPADRQLAELRERNRAREAVTA